MTDLLSLLPPGMPSPTSLPGIALIGAALLVSYIILQAIYNLTLHPLASHPGPFLHRASFFPYLYRQVTGTLPLDMLAFHARYGPVVRISPDQLSFSDPQAWKDIYGHRSPGQPEFPKPYFFYRAKNLPPSLLSESRENHGTLRRLMAHGFSERSMRAQEGIIGGYVNMLINGLRNASGGFGGEQGEGRNGVSEKEKEGVRVARSTGEKEGKPPVPVNMVSWYNWTTFDVISDLAFGEPFGCLKKAEYDPWVDAIGKGVRFGTVLMAIRTLGLEDVLLPIIENLSNKARRFHRKRTMDRLERRVNLTKERPDFMEGLLQKKEEWGMDMERLAANAGLLIIAGSETTATLLSGATYLLLKHPEAMKKLTEEVRSTFKSEEEITLSSVGSLEYMLACLNEAMRVYPPVPIGMPRVVPKGGAKVAGTFVPEGTVVAVWQWATNHNEQHFVEPFEFHPERWMHDPQFANDRLDAVQPFNVGPRNCLGRNLAIAEMRLILAKIVFNFDMQLANHGKDWLDQRGFIVWDKHPLPVYLTPVERNGV
ncbi:cytochrome P450 [Pseudoneurospora amorphoporcata]|uniref:Cytochrome P450 n=1 Tax=Pseudoneurospora amorphoporcata TaxID=241081 RepID=A0AAN6P0F0_9PEZI|nr:cytochrome P450 [Pseudoneurospora amorphoporcata]